MGVAEVREGSFCFCGLNLEINVLLEKKKKRIPWTEEPGSPWGHKQLDMTECMCHTRVHAHAQAHTYMHVIR